MASGDKILEVSDLKVKQDNATGTEQSTVLGPATDKAPASTPEPYVHPTQGYTTVAALLGDVTLNLSVRNNPYASPAESGTHETLFDTTKKYKLTITEV